MVVLLRFYAKQMDPVAFFSWPDSSVSSIGPAVKKQDVATVAWGWWATSIERPRIRRATPWSTMFSREKSRWEALAFPESFVLKDLKHVKKVDFKFQQKRLHMRWKLTRYLFHHFTGQVVPSTWRVANHWIQREDHVPDAGHFLRCSGWSKDVYVCNMLQIL